MRERVQLLTCDRCSFTTTLHMDDTESYYLSPPSGWTQILDKNSESIDLCPVCAKAFRDFVKNER